MHIYTCKTCLSINSEKKEVFLLNKHHSIMVILSSSHNKFQKLQQIFKINEIKYHIRDTKGTLTLCNIMTMYPYTFVAGR